MDLATILAKSSNVGAVQVSMKLDKEMLWNTLSRFGAGRLTSSGYPGESAGMLPPIPGLAADRPGDHGLRLRAVHDAAAAGAGLCRAGG